MVELVVFDSLQEGSPALVRRVLSGCSLLSWMPTQPPADPTITQLPVALERLDLR